ncbi:MAG: hypothetical protein HPY72_01095 [Anaerolineae bacterium]|nr:hypothetical protein [Anaerolineae bacterium]
MKKGWYNEKIGLVLLLVGAAIFVLAFIIMNPLGTAIGPSESGSRVVLLNIMAFVFCLPWGAYWMYKFAQHADWLAMPGRFIKGLKTKVFSPYALVGIAIIGALFAAAGFGDLGGLDVQAMVIAASASLFGSVVSFFGLFVGQIIARVFINPVWSGGSSTAVSTLIAYTLIDASIWAYAGYMYFKNVVNRGDKPFFGRFLVTLLLTEAVHQPWWFTTYWIMNTREAAITNVLADWVVLGAGNLFFPYWWLSFLFVATGFLAGEAARRVISGGRTKEEED